MSKMLILTGRYLPGYKDGGPVRSIINLTEIFGLEHEINIVCLDRDHGDNKPYDGVKIGEYNTVGNANVYYAAEDDYNIQLIERLAAGMDVVYCCGPYGSYARSAMKLNRQHRLNCPLVIAPMGSFSPEAYAIKGVKKRAYITLMRLMGMFDNVIWSVTSEREDAELKAVFGANIQTVIAQDLPRTDELSHPKIKQAGHLDIIFLSRISRKKNLLAAAQILKLLPNDISCDFDIYGIMEDENYYRECETLLKTLPANVKYEYKGEVDSEDVLEIMSGYDVFLFPTLGENYGHVIAEAMAAGAVPVISDETPWLNLEKSGAGYDIPLVNIAEYAAVLKELALEDEEAFRLRTDRTKQYIKEHNRESIANSGYKKIFDIGRKHD